MNTLKDKAELVTGETTTIERRIFMNSIRNMAASLAVAVALAISVSAQAHQLQYRTRCRPIPTVPSIATNQQQDEVMTLMAAYLGLWLAEDPSRYAFEQFVTEDAVFEYPYADYASRRFEGRKAIGQALRKFPVIASNWKFTDLQLYQTLYPDTFFRCVQGERLRACDSAHLRVKLPRAHYRERRKDRRLLRVVGARRQGSCLWHYRPELIATLSSLQQCWI